ncbi:hypothetical protein GGI43DRAFT_196831 [Trichoderma evansii]
MSTPEISSDSIIRYVHGAKSALDGANVYCAKVVREIPDLPKTFPVTAKHLPTLLAVFTTIHTSLNSISDGDEELIDVNGEHNRINDKQDHNIEKQDNGNDKQDLSKIYQSINETMQDYGGHVSYLQLLFETVRSRNDNADLRLKKYKKIVQNHKGMGLEKVMLHLLNCAIRVAKAPLVTGKEIKDLEGALNEVTDLTPLSDDCLGGGTMNNYGTGNQFQHNGNGNQNICEDGFQVNGNNDHAVYNYQARQKEADKPDKP